MTWGTALLCILAIAIGVTWIVLCYKKIIPDPAAKWTMAIAGGLITLGLLPLIQWLAKQGKETKPVPIPDYNPVGPTEEDTKKLDEKVESTDKKLEEIDAEDKKISEEITVDSENIRPNVGFEPTLGGDFAERLRKLKEIKAAKERSIREARTYADVIDTRGDKD